MNPLQTDILRRMAQLLIAPRLTDSSGEAVQWFGEEIPAMFLWMEFWEFKMDRGGSVAEVFNKALDGLVTQGALSAKERMVFRPHEQAWVYRTERGARWQIEFQRIDRVMALDDGKTITIPGIDRRWLAYPKGGRARFLRRCDNAGPNILNLFTREGFYVDGWKHLHYSITPPGWDMVPLTADDLRSGGASSNVSRERARASADTTRRVRSPALVIDKKARLASWNGKPLGINAHADFDVLGVVSDADGAIVSYAGLFDAVKPGQVSKSVQQTEAPPEVKEAVSHVNRALRKVGYNGKIENVRRTGYRLRSPDE